MRFRWACITICAAQFWGCENPHPALTHVEPGQAYSDAEVRLTLTGDNFLPATTLDPGSGSRIATMDGFHVRVGKANAWAELTDLAWQSTSQMTGLLPGDVADALPQEELDVEISDPRGQRAVILDAFHELGRDLAPPFALFTNPSADTPVGPGTLLRGNIFVADTPPGVLASLEWTYSVNDSDLDSATCRAAEQAASANCAFQVRVSPNLKGKDQIKVVATATDASQNHNSYTTSLLFTVHAPVTVTSILPTSGGIAGGTDVVITGTDFIVGTKAFMDGLPLFPDGGIVVNENTLSGHVPAHAAGAISITIHTPLSDATSAFTFTYAPPPSLESITPSTGDATGNTTVILAGKGFGPGTQIYFGPTLERAVPLVDLYLQSDSTIIGRAPAGNGQTTVWAFDENLGFTRLPNGFIWRAP
jgi:hypothetical protein